MGMLNIFLCVYIQIAFDDFYKFILYLIYNLTYELKKDKISINYQERNGDLLGHYIGCTNPQLFF
jgi:hypothetical protein